MLRQYLGRVFCEARRGGARLTRRAGELDRRPEPAIAADFRYHSPMCGVLGGHHFVHRQHGACRNAVLDQVRGKLMSVGLRQESDELSVQGRAVLYPAGIVAKASVIGEFRFAEQLAQFAELTVIAEAMKTSPVKVGSFS